MKVVFFGTPPFAAKLLKVLLEQGFSIVAIITKPDKPQGRSKEPLFPAVKETALLYAPNIPLFQPEFVSAPDFAPTLAQFDADLFVVVAYGEIIKQHLLDMPRLGCINVHASILPKYRGAAPIQRAIIGGEEESGVTIMQMVRKMDAGDMIRVAKVPIGQNMIYGELENELCEAA
ncbi:MAG: methionyl-tRNA formyltransferase, partial [Parachlamydiaceae bacterium]|nr:methionyl-tRNA formyltransferase [Parachlamydiaceae bacterium]